MFGELQVMRVLIILFLIACGVEEAETDFQSIYKSNVPTVETPKEETLKDTGVISFEELPDFDEPVTNSTPAPVPLPTATITISQIPDSGEPIVSLEEKLQGEIIYCDKEIRAFWNTIVAYMAKKTVGVKRLVFAYMLVEYSEWRKQIRYPVILGQPYGYNFAGMDVDDLVVHKNTCNGFLQHIHNNCDSALFRIRENKPCHLWYDYIWYIADYICDCGIRDVCDESLLEPKMVPKTEGKKAMCKFSR